VYVSNTTEFKLLKPFLQDSKIEFFTHQLKEEKMSKFVVYGLPNVKIEKIQNEHVLRGFNPCDIKLFKIRRTRYEHHTNYLGERIKIIDTKFSRPFPIPPKCMFPESTCIKINFGTNLEFLSPAVAEEKVGQFCIFFRIPSYRWSY
jgi:hypothetical protein